ncbi:hypothetical protein [Kocuria flava]|uniref:hypothetical protein n=1 Tax=Kocuria flava TaxID=446860 RepID=UPI00118085AD|nr:hypothetical protein [Kocuria flava]
MPRPAATAPLLPSRTATRRRRPAGATPPRPARGQPLRPGCSAHARGARPAAAVELRPAPGAGRTLGTRSAAGSRPSCGHDRPDADDPAALRRAVAGAVRAGETAP